MLQGRYGHDKLNRALFISALALSVLSFIVSLFKVPVVPFTLSVLSWVALIAGVARMLSKNFYARQQELSWYLQLEAKFSAWWRRTFQKGKSNVYSFSRERRNFKILVCPQCSQRLRVPRGKGKLRVSCTKCGCKFEAKS